MVFFQTQEHQQICGFKNTSSYRGCKTKQRGISGVLEKDRNLKIEAICKIDSFCYVWQLTPRSVSNSFILVWLIF